MIIFLLYKAILYNFIYFQTGSSDLVEDIGVGFLLELREDTQTDFSV